VEVLQMHEFLETTVDKFIFRVATDRYYSSDGLWAKVEGDHVRIGMTDFLQQRSGDVAFAEVKPIGTQLSFGDEVSVIETIKVDISLYSPVSGTVLEVNPALDDSPEVINQDPYGEGWVMVVAPEDLEAELEGLAHGTEAVTEYIDRQIEKAEKIKAEGGGGEE
jgi:glycine cleavage system H protein